MSIYLELMCSHHLDSLWILNGGLGFERSFKHRPPRLVLVCPACGEVEIVFMLEPLEQTSCNFAFASGFGGSVERFSRMQMPKDSQC